MIDVKRISNWEKEYLTMNKNLTKIEKEILEGSELKTNEGMVFGRMYAPVSYTHLTLPTICSV